MRTLISMMVIALITSACGGDTTTDESPDETSAASATTMALGDDAVRDDAEAPSTTAEPSPSEETVIVGEPISGSEAVLSLGDETYRFLLGENGSCDPDFFGTFRALLTRVDASDRPVADPAGEGFTQGITIALTTDADGLIGGNLDGVAWSAGSDDFEASSIDSVAIHGNRAEATATFVDVESGETVDGSLEVVCVDDAAASSAASGDFCSAVGSSHAMDDDFNFNNPELDRLLPEAVEQFDVLRSVAPPEIADDVHVVYEALVAMDGIFAEQDYDVRAIAEEELQSVADEDVQASAERISEYCDLDG